MGAPGIRSRPLYQLKAEGAFILNAGDPHPVHHILLLVVDKGVFLSPQSEKINPGSSMVSRALFSISAEMKGRMFGRSREFNEGES